MSEPTHIDAKTARYIKFGAGGVWEALCLKEGTLRLGFYEVSHEAGLSGDKEAIKQAFASITKEGSGSAANYARQVLEFYDTSPDILWFTFADGYSWWCQASPDVEYLGRDPAMYPHGSRLRRTVNGWSNRSIKGIGERRKVHQHILVDGHFTLLNSLEEITILDENVFQYITPDLLIVLHDSPEKIRQRLEARDGKSPATVEKINHHQKLEIEHARKIAAALKKKLVELKPDAKSLEEISKYLEEPKFTAANS